MTLKKFLSIWSKKKLLWKSIFVTMELYFIRWQKFWQCPSLIQLISEQGITKIFFKSMWSSLLGKYFGDLLFRFPINWASQAGAICRISFHLVLWQPPSKGCPVRVPLCVITFAYFKWPLRQGLSDRVAYGTCLQRKKCKLNLI